MQPRLLVTSTIPDAPPAGTVAYNCVAEEGTKLAETPLNFTELMLSRFDPETKTLLPTCAGFGAMLEIIGFGFTVTMVLADFEQPFTVTETEYVPVEVT